MAPEIKQLDLTSNDMSGTCLLYIVSIKHLSVISKLLFIFAFFVRKIKISHIFDFLLSAAVHELKELSYN